MFSTKAKCDMRHFRRICLWLILGLAVYGGLLVPLVQQLTLPNEITLTPSEYARLASQPHRLVSNDTQEAQYITVKLFGFLPLKQVLVNVLPFDSVLVGGTPIGICGQIDGVLVTADCEPLQKGDVIVAVNGEKVHNLAEFGEKWRIDQPLRLTFNRQQRELTKEVTLNQPLPTRDTTSGVGILTFVNPETYTFSALGHQMGDFDTGATVNLSGGSIKSVKVFGIEPTIGKKTGLLKSSIRQNSAPQGSITHGNRYGVAGCLFADSEILAQTTTELPVATRYQVKPGKATLRTSLDGVTVEEFACEIIKTRYQNAKADKSMVIRVTDPRLLSQTGGIIHGMSGSPIIQNGHLVGVLTHALTHDAAKGYAIYVDFAAI